MLVIPGFDMRIILLLVFVLTCSCREDDPELIYPLNEDLVMYPDEPLNFDTEVDFDDAVPEDTSDLPPLCSDYTEYTQRHFNNMYSPYLGGDESVDLEIISISYFGCPHCAVWAETYEEVWQRRDDIRDRVRIYFHHFPFSMTEAYELHAAAHAAGLQGSRYFWAVHNFIFVNVSNGYMVSISEIDGYIDDELNMDRDQWAQDMDSTSNPNLYYFLDWDKGQSAALEVSSVPTVFICGEDINEFPGGRDNIEGIVDGFLN